MMFREAGKALDLLREHHGSWPAGQLRDFAVASARMLRATIMVGGYHAGVELIPDTLVTYLSAPSDRARRELRYCRRLVRDRARATNSLPLQTLRTRIEEALRGDLNL